MGSALTLTGDHGMAGGQVRLQYTQEVRSASALLAACCCRSEYARSEMGDGSASVAGQPNDDGPEHDLLPDMPPSWVPKLTIPRDMLDMRCPRVSTTVAGVSGGLLLSTVAQLRPREGSRFA
eukprot:GHUV01052309.1.p2 GENE.GHUV01052309.1~~GHUV01052309.1.p2  ORF type:complete len:122 (-),score=22.63 GHUV01052309.1:267-632(-)